MRGFDMCWRFALFSTASSHTFASGITWSGSGKVPAGADASGGSHTASTTAEPTSLIPWAAFGLGLLVYATRCSFSPQPDLRPTHPDRRWRILARSPSFSPFASLSDQGGVLLRGSSRGATGISARQPALSLDQWTSFANYNGDFGGRAAHRPGSQVSVLGHLTKFWPSRAPSYPPSAHRPAPGQTRREVRKDDHPARTQSPTS